MSAGIRVVIRDITSDLGVPTFVAAGWETPGLAESISTVASAHIRTRAWP